MINDNISGSSSSNNNNNDSNSNNNNNDSSINNYKSKFVKYSKVAWVGISKEVNIKVYKEKKEEKWKLQRDLSQST